MNSHKISFSKLKRFWGAVRTIEEYKGKKITKPLFYLTRKYIGNSVLDIGAGNGEIIEYFKDRYQKSSFYGIDIVPRKDKGIVYGSIDSIPFPDSKFDTILITDVIEHLTSKQIKDGIIEMKRVLKPDGCIILTTVYEEKLGDSVVHCFYCDNIYHRYGHLQSFTKKSMKNLFAQEGFKTELIKREDFFYLSKYIAETKETGGARIQLCQNYALTGSFFENIWALLDYTAHGISYEFKSRFLGEKFVNRQLEKERFGNDLLAIFRK